MMQETRLTVIGESRRGGRRYFNCVCRCGMSTAVRIDHFNSGRTRSCGCLWKDENSRRSFNYRHGDRYSSDGKPTPEYVSWSRMIDRCENPNNNRFQHYGGRGIRVCERWRASYPDFLNDMGRKPSARHSLDRIDVDENYFPGNCRWATSTEQRVNRRDRKEH